MYTYVYACINIYRYIKYVHTYILYIYMYIYMYMYMYKYIYLYICLFISACICTCICTYIYAHTHTCAWTRKETYVYGKRPVYMNQKTSLHIQKYGHRHRHSHRHRHRLRHTHKHRYRPKPRTRPRPRPRHRCWHKVSQFGSISVFFNVYKNLCLWARRYATYTRT